MSFDPHNSIEHDRFLALMEQQREPGDDHSREKLQRLQQDAAELSRQIETGHLSLRRCASMAERLLSWSDRE